MVFNVQIPITKIVVLTGMLNGGNFPHDKVFIYTELSEPTYPFKNVVFEINCDHKLGETWVRKQFPNVKEIEVIDFENKRNRVIQNFKTFISRYEAENKKYMNTDTLESDVNALNHALSLIKKKQCALAFDTLSRLDTAVREEISHELWEILKKTN